MENARKPERKMDSRGLLVILAKIELDFRAIRNETEHVHLRAKLDVLAAGGNPVGKREAALGRDGNVHEEIDVRGQISLRQRYPRARRRQEETVAAVVRDAGLEAG